MPVRFHAVFIFRKAVVRIWDNEPQNVTSGFTDLLEAYAAVFIYAGNHITVMEGLSVSYPHAYCVQKITDMLLGEVYDRLEIHVSIFLHSMRVCIAKIWIWIWYGIVKNIVYDPVRSCIHTPSYADSISKNSCSVSILMPSCCAFVSLLPAFSPQIR